ncbi:MAG: alanine--tRNA ligase-related protein, partial [Bacilli bacterium]|nr:alanine--tRNA ligase-related protein [Bacilli bacterium]
TKIIALFDGTNFVSTLTNEGYIVLEKTPFYAESGGQVSDSGIIMDNGKILTIEEIFKSPNKQHFHYVKFEGTISLDDEVKAMVDKSKRYDIMKNHSATHLLQKALQEVLGSSVHQAGSKVDENGLRFDFVYDKKISTDELINIEKLVNDKIKTNSATITEIMSSKDAKQTGAMALFDEKYGNEVRVVSMADSKELCGGTHVQNVSDIEKFAIKSLENKGNSVYRIEGVTADKIDEALFLAIKPYNDEMIKLLVKAKKIVADALADDIHLDFDFNINNDAPKSYHDIVFNLKEMEMIKQKVQHLEKEYINLKASKMLENLDIFTNQLEEIKGISVIIAKIEDYNNEILKQIVDKLANSYDKAFIFVANISGDNVNYFAKATANLKEVLSCGSIVKEASLKSRGNGGGSPLFAQGGGSSIKKIDDILSTVRETILDI